VDSDSTVRVGEAVLWHLAAYGVDMIFGIPGVHNLELYRALDQVGIRHIGARHEQGAGFMADGYARATGRPGMCLVISGPGVTNAATPLGQAYSDSIPLLLLSSTIATSGIGLRSGLLHEVSHQSQVTSPLTTFSATAYTPSQVPILINQAFATFATRRPGPVHISIPTDVLEMPAAVWEVSKALTRPMPATTALDSAAAVLSAAESVMMVVGGGAIQATPQVRRLAEMLRAPVVTTIAGKGILSDNHPLCLGATLQRPEVRSLLRRASVVLAVGTEIAEPDLYVTADAEADSTASPAETIAPATGNLTHGLMVRIDVDPNVIAGGQPCAVGIVGDAAASLAGLAERVTPPQGSAPRVDIQALRTRMRTAVSPLETLHLKVLDAVRKGLPADAIVCADMTQLAYTACVHFPMFEPRTWLFPTGYGTLGYALPAAIGAKLGCPERPVLALVGDGGLLFTVQELATAVEQALPLPILLWNNDGFGEIETFMQARQIPQISVRPRNPDFMALGAAFGCETVRPLDMEGIEAAISLALRRPRPTLIEVRQDSRYLQG
jgi:5-guanidino-2-oxopentanoate decarboxylase